MISNPAFWLRLTSSFCELLGAFFLAVEAMKLENFRRLRDHILRPFYSFINPTLTFDGKPAAAGPPPPDWRDRPPDQKIFNLSFFLFTAVGATTDCAILIGMCGSLRQFFTLWSRIPGPLWTDTVALLLAAVFASVMTGLIIYTLFVGIVSITIRFLNLIDRYTPTGTIGIIGFLCFLAAFVIRNWFEWK
jgi:hypothetical protein